VHSCALLSGSTDVTHLSVFIVFFEQINGLRITDLMIILRDDVNKCSFIVYINMLCHIYNVKTVYKIFWKLALSYICLKIGIRRTKFLRLS